jgi:uncharacterized membrane protein
MQDRPPHRAPRSRIMATLNALVRTRLTAGVVTLLPLLISVWVVKLVFIWMRDASRWAVQAFLLSPAGKPYLGKLHFDFDRWERLKETGLLHIQETFFELMPWHVRWAIAFFSILLTLFVLYLVGMLAANLFGRRIINWVEQILDRVPLIKTVYRGLKQVLASFAGATPQNFQRVAMFPFLTSGVYSIGFITSSFRDTTTGDEFVTIFYATTPNPTTGFVLIVPRKDVVELDWSVEQAVQVIMSGGILMPDRASVPGSVPRAPLAGPAVAMPRL